MKPLFRRLMAFKLERLVVRLIRANPKLKIVAVGGSVGKTSTKLAIATVLKQKYSVLFHDGNYNSELSLPLSLFDLEVPAKVTSVSEWFKLLRIAQAKTKQPYPYEVAVLELGTDHPGDIPHFMTYLRPDIGIVTAIAHEHMEFFGSLEAVGDEEFALDLSSRAVVLHADDRLLMERKGQLGERPVLTYGETGEVRWVGDDEVYLGEAVEETIKVHPQVLGDHSRLALLAAAALGVELKLTPSEIRDGINEVVPVPGRMQQLKGRKETVIIDDSYNAAPEAALAALVTLNEVAKGRKIALLGQMNELGTYSREAHEKVGTAAAKLDLLLTLGKEANTILGPAAVKVGLPKTKWHRFDSPYDAGKWLNKEIKRGDTILVKGSQNGVFAEEAIKPILANPADEARLVRQSPTWLARKAAQFGVVLSAK